MANSNTDSQPKGIPVTTKLSYNIYTGIQQYTFDMGLPYPQDAIRILLAKGLEASGYPKQVHERFPLPVTKK